MLERPALRPFLATLVTGLLLLPSAALAGAPCAPETPTKKLVENITKAVGTTPEPPRPTAETDTDGDGVPDVRDAFPHNYRESKDSDGDGVGDVGDAFPNDPKESRDSDCDGTGDNADKKFDGTGVCTTVNYRWSDGAYGFHSKFDLRTNPDGTMTATVRIRLTGERDATREAAWEKATEEMFSRNGLTVDVVFQSEATGAHSSVNVARGNGRANASQLFTGDDGLTVAHEVGHHLGLVDEYADSGDPARFIGESDSIMRSVWGTPRAYARHLDMIKSLFRCP